MIIQTTLDLYNVFRKSTNHVRFVDWVESYGGKINTTSRENYMFNRLGVYFYFADVWVGIDQIEFVNARDYYMFVMECM